jgi:TetR/AcrR family transcriptional regulator, ethionamide resistance regulator
VTARPDVKRRHRERRELSRRRILDAARELLEDRPWSQVGIEDVTQRADLTRTAFYRHFDDRQTLLLAVLEDVGVGLDLIADPWERGTGDPLETLRAALRELVDVFHRHGRLLRAIADASTEDPEVAALYADLGARLSASAAKRIAIEVAEGRSTVADPQEVGSALVWMNERFLLDRFGQAPLGDPERATGALVEVWLRTVYGRGPGDA